jgi:hypothetical protein
MALPAAAQTQAQQDRLEQIGRYAVTSAVCEQLGMTMMPDAGKYVASQLDRETASWGLSKSTVDRLASQALDRESAIFQTDLAAAGQAKTEAQLRGVRPIMARYARMCVTIARDPIFAQVVTAPPGYDPEKAATDWSDAVLAAGGLATWQTPAIRARGDLMMMIGSCRSMMDPTRSDALKAEVGRSDDPRTREYYLASFDRGMEGGRIVHSRADCIRVINGLKAKLPK